MLIGTYKSYCHLKQIVKKFNDERVETRVKDKLTIKREDYYTIWYKIDGYYYRAYDKPFLIVKDKCLSDILYHRLDRSNEIPYGVGFSGCRIFFNRTFRNHVGKVSSNYVYQIQNIYFYENGYRCNDTDDKTVDIFDL